MDDMYAAPQLRVQIRDVSDVWRAGRSFEAGGLAALQSRCVDKRADTAGRRDDLSVAAVKDLAWRLRVVSRLFFGPQRCMFECATTSVPLCRRGLDVVVVIGRNCSPARGQDTVHAWLELDGTPLTDDLVRGFYTTVQTWSPLSRPAVRLGGVRT